MTLIPIQSDRDAAAAIFVTSRARAACVRGEYDGSDFVQAFASYRLQIMEEAAKEISELRQKLANSIQFAGGRSPATCGPSGSAANRTRTNHRANEGGGDD